jgi:hypothetical protein
MIMSWFLDQRLKDLSLPWRERTILEVMAERESEAVKKGQRRFMKVGDLFNDPKLSYPEIYPPLAPLELANLLERLGEKELIDIGARHAPIIMLQYIHKVFRELAGRPAPTFLTLQMKRGLANHSINREWIWLTPLSRRLLGQRPVPITERLYYVGKRAVNAAYMLAARILVQPVLARQPQVSYTARPETFDL